MHGQYRRIPHHFSNPEDLLVFLLRELVLEHLLELLDLAVRVHLELEQHLLDTAELLCGLVARVFIDVARQVAKLGGGS